MKDCHSPARKVETYNWLLTASLQVQSPDDPLANMNTSSGDQTEKHEQYLAPFHVRVTRQFDDLGGRASWVTEQKILMNVHSHLFVSAIILKKHL